MTRYLISRVLQAIGVLVGACAVVFVGIQLLPGDPLTNYLNSGDTPLPPESVDVIKAYYGYDSPLWEQLLKQVGSVFDGTFGYSFITGRSVIDEFTRSIVPTLQLAGTAFVFAGIYVFVIVTGASLSRHTWIREVLASVPPFIAGIPSFWLGLMALQVLSIRLGLMSLFPDNTFLSLAVPAAILGLYLAAPISQVLVKAVGNAQNEPFVTVLRAKGASESRIYFHHLLKYTAGSGVTIVGLLIGGLISGTVIVETVFSRQGVGQNLAFAVSHQDIALVQGFVLIFAGVYVVVNLIVDLLYPLFDPRIALRESVV
ncbi:ABC transporter permease [Mycobacterium sp. C31M]